MKLYVLCIILGKHKIIAFLESFSNNVGVICPFFFNRYIYTTAPASVDQGTLRKMGEKVCKNQNTRKSTVRQRQSFLKKWLHK